MFTLQYLNQISELNGIKVIHLLEGVSNRFSFEEVLYRLWTPWKMDPGSIFYYRIWTPVIEFEPGVHVLWGSICAIEYGPRIENGPGSIIYRDPYSMGVHIIWVIGYGYGG